MARSFHSKVAGVTKQNDDRSSRQDVVRTCFRGEQLVLEREPDNRYDPNAIKLLRKNGLQLGYIGAHLADELASWLDRGRVVTAHVSDITGGEDKNYGVNIKITKYSDGGSPSATALGTFGAMWNAGRWSMRLGVLLLPVGVALVLLDKWPTLGTALYVAGVVGIVLGVVVRLTGRVGSWFAR